MVAAMQRALFQNYVEYADAELEQHCQQFYKSNVLNRYLTMMENPS
jgi:hypothetical protein